MKKVMLILTIMFSFLITNVANAVSNDAFVLTPGQSTSGLTLPGVLLVVGAAYLAYTDKVQACDNLPIKTVNSSDSNFSYEVTGCEYAKDTVSLASEVDAKSYASSEVGLLKTARMHN